MIQVVDQASGIGEEHDACKVYIAQAVETGARRAEGVGQLSAQRDREESGEWRMQMGQRCPVTVRPTATGVANGQKPWRVNDADCDAARLEEERRLASLRHKTARSRRTARGVPTA